MEEKAFQYGLFSLVFHTVPELCDRQVSVHGSPRRACSAHSETHFPAQTPSTHTTSTTAVVSYAIGSRKLSANEQFFVGAQTVVSLLQTTQIKQGVLFIVANKVYTSTNKTTIV